MEVLNVPEEKEEEVTLAVEEFLCGKEKVKGVNFHYQSRSHSLLVIFQCKEDEKRLHKNFSRIRLDENIFYEVKWAAQNNSPPMTEATASQKISVEILDAIDKDIVSDHLERVLGYRPPYTYDQVHNRMVACLRSHGDKARVLAEGNVFIADNGRVRMRPFQCKSSGSLNRSNLVEVLNVTDEDIVADYFKDILGNLPQYLYNNKRHRMVLFLQTDEEKDKVLCDDRPFIEDHGPVCVKFIEPAAPGTKFYVEVLNATDEDIVIDYFASLISRHAVYKYFEESARMVVTLENRTEFETLLTKEGHQIEDLNDEVWVREWTPPVKGLKVTGIPSSVSQKFLNCYFKDETHGGGAIKTLKWDSANRTATVFFHQHDVAERVISKGPHTIREIALSMELIEDKYVEEAASNPASCNDEKDNISREPASNYTGDCQDQVTSCLVVYSDTGNVDEIKRNIRKSWQLHDGEFELHFNPSERVGIVRVTTTAAKLDQAVAKPLKNGAKFEKCDQEINSVLGDVQVLIEQISAETSREAVWSWLMVVTRCAAHTVYYSDVLPSNDMKAVALISFHEGLELETSLAKASDVQYVIDDRTLSARVIRSPLKLMYVGITKKNELHVKRELQQLLDLDGNDGGKVDDVTFFDDHAIVSLSSKEAFRKLLMNDSCLGCSCVLPYYDQLGCISSTHVVDYSTLATKIRGDWPTSEIGQFVCPRLSVTVAGSKLKEDILRKFFADRSVSGGDKSAALHSNTDGSFVVTFDDPQAADRVYQKYQNEGLKLGSSNLSVFIRGMRETPNSSKNQILVRNIGLASEDSIKYFLWALANTSVARLTFVRDSHDGALCAVARFERDIDRYRLAYYCEIATLDCKRLDVEPVEQPRALALYNVPNNADKQLVKYCFEPDDVADCVEKENGIWIIYFKNPQYAAEALASDLLYDGTIRLSAEIYSEYQVEKNAREKGKRGWHQIRCSRASLPIVNFVKKWRQRDFYGLIKDTRAVCDFTNDGHFLIRLSGSHSADHVRFVEEKFLSFLNNYTFSQVDVLPDLWSDVLNSKELVEIQRLEKSVLHIEARECDQDKSICRIELTGCCSAVQSARQKVEQAIRCISDEKERRKQRTSHTEVLSPWIVKLLMANNICKKLQEKYKNTDTFLEIDESRCTCHLEGLPSDVKAVLDEMNSIVKSCKEATFEVSPQASDFMERISVATTIGNKLAQAALTSTVLWCIPRACLVQVQSLDAEAAQEAIRIMRNEITDTFVSVGEGMQAFLNTEKWKDCVDAIRGRRNGDVIIVENSASCKLHVVCWTSDSTQVLEEINNFTRKNVIKTEFLQLPRAVVQLLTTAMLPDIKKMEQDEARHYVRLTSKLVDRGASGFHIAGNVDGVANIKRMLKDLVTKHPKLVTTLHNVSDPGSLAFFKDNLLVLQDIGMKTKTYVEVFDPNSSDESCAVDDSDEVTVLPGDVAVEIKRADITELECDVIVNPSNENLRHSGGLAAAIAHAAGQDLVNECQDYVRRHGTLREGQVCTTSAGSGKLRCKKVVHAVGPQWKGGNRSEVNRLFQAVQNSLYCVEQCGLASVAFPPISSGIFNYPLDKCTDTIVESLVSYCGQKKGSLSRVLLVDINEEGVQQFRRALNRYLGKESKPDLKSDAHVQKDKARPQPRTTGITRKTSPTSTFTIGEVCVEIINGDVTSQQVDVIVSTITEDLDLSAGALSKLIAKEAGNELQEQLHSQYSSPFNKGDIAVTDGHRLACKKVYHVCCPEFVSSQCSRPVQKLTLKCLKEANDRMLSSIALPAVGTGNLLHPIDAVAEQMYHAAVLFCSSVRSPALRNVKFVLKDSGIYESFIAYHSSFRHGTLFSQYRPTNGAAREAAFVYEEAAASAVASNNHCDQSVSSATLSASRKDLEVSGVHIEVLHGDISEHDSEAIVNCTNSDFSLDSQVAKALCMKGGPALAEECRKKASVDSIRRTGVFLQKAASLKCRYVIHVDSELDLKEVMWKCLKRADDEHVTSVAFPAVGTGAKGRKASEVAPLLVQALVEFLRDGGCRYLRRVQFVIFNHSLLQSFQEALDTAIVLNVQADFLNSGVSRRFESRSSHNEFSAEVPLNADDRLSDLVLSICGTEETIKKAILELKKQCETAMKVREISDAPDIIEELTDEEVENFLQLEKRLGIAIDINKRRKLITLRSMDEASLIKARIAIVKSLYDRRTTVLNEKISYLDVRNLQKEAENVCSRVLWQYKAKDSPNWSNYPLALSKKIEEGYAKKLSSVNYGLSTFSFTIDLSKNVDSSDSQLDVDVNVRRQDLNLDLPDYWNSNSNYEEVILDSNSSEYLQVKKEFMSTLFATTTKVLQITRVQNPHYYRQYVQQKARVQSGMSPGCKLPVERKLWHGTNEGILKSICHGGFNRGYCGKNATYYGLGVYFARDASYSWHDTYSVPNAAGEKFIMQCLVLTGEYEVGNQTTVFPNKKPPPSHFNFDTTVNNVNDPILFVTYNDVQAYPAYIIKFHVPSI